MVKSLKFWQLEYWTAATPAQGRGQRFLRLCLPLTMAVGTVLLILYHIQQNLIHKQIIATEQRALEQKTAGMAHRFNMIRSDLMVLAGKQELRAMVDPQVDSRQFQQLQAALAQEYLVMSQQKQEYDQIRFLDLTGQEVVRVNFNQGEPTIVVDQAQLQNKSQRYWFQGTLALPDGGIFISPLDLNIEFGTIEQPIKPVIRFGTSVFDRQGNPQGIVIINYLAQTFLGELSPEYSQSFGNVLLLNQEGYWLKGTRSEDEWGFMYDGRQDRTFAQAFPQAWQQIQAQEMGQFHNSTGLYTFTTLYPLVKIQASTFSANLPAVDSTGTDPKSYYWKLVTHVPRTLLNQQSRALRNQLFVLFVGLTGLTIVSSWLLVQARIKREQSEQETKGLEQTLLNVHRNQAQLVQQEKMVSLGQLVAGVAHEINNPVNFIHGNLKYTHDYAQGLLGLIELYQKHYPTPNSEILAEIKNIDLEFIQDDLPKLLASMDMGAERIREIVLSLRNFSRMDESESKTVNIHEGIDSTLLILQHRLNQDFSGRIEVIRNYGDLPPVECFPGQLNQVFMNLLVNGIDALEEMAQKPPTKSSPTKSPPTKSPPTPSQQLVIETTLLDQDWIEIAIIDNGPGMSLQVQKQIFDPFFTTKPVGKGTGMGLAISYQIVTEKHGGQLKCFSTPGKGTKFSIQIPLRQII